MAKHKEIHGVIAAALTPLHADGSLALEDWPLFLDFLARRGCHGALLLGTTGEGPSFAPEERLSILKAALAIRQVHPDFLLLVGTGTPSLEETAALTRAVFDLGADGVVVLPPYYYRKVEPDGLFEWFARVIRSSVPAGAACLVYHIPGITGIQVGPDLLARLLDAFPDRGLGIKDSTVDPEFARLLGDRFGKDLLVFNGTDSLVDLALEHAATGCITAMANLRSPDLRLVWEARCAGTVDLGARQRLDKARALMDRYPPNPPLYKALLPLIHGLPEWALRPPLTRLDPEKAGRILAEARAEVDGFEA
jgi:4-hydroxy-tetrahydrodipicolinate synthase